VPFPLSPCPPLPLSCCVCPFAGAWGRCGAVRLCVLVPLSVGLRTQAQDSCKANCRTDTHSDSKATTQEEKRRTHTGTRKQENNGKDTGHGRIGARPPSSGPFSFLPPAAPLSPTSSSHVAPTANTQTSTSKQSRMRGNGVQWKL
jgi:hypothetical protein